MKDIFTCAFKEKNDKKLGWIFVRQNNLNEYFYLLVGAVWIFPPLQIST